MGHMFTCVCSWTLITQEGEDDAVMHAEIHVRDAHGGTNPSKENIRAMVKTV